MIEALRAQPSHDFVSFTIIHEPHSFSASDTSAQAQRSRAGRDGIEMAAIAELDRYAEIERGILNRGTGMGIVFEAGENRKAIDTRTDHRRLLPWQVPTFGEPKEPFSPAVSMNFSHGRVTRSTRHVGPSEPLLDSGQRRRIRPKQPRFAEGGRR